MIIVETIPPCDGCGEPAFSEVTLTFEGRAPFRVGDYCLACQDAIAAKQTILLRCSCGFETFSPGQGPLVERAKNRMLRHLNKNMDCALMHLVTDPEGEMQPRPLQPPKAAPKAAPAAQQLSFFEEVNL